MGAKAPGIVSMEKAKAEHFLEEVLGAKAVAEPTRRARVVNFIVMF